MEVLFVLNWMKSEENADLCFFLLFQSELDSVGAFGGGVSPVYFCSLHA